MSTSHRPFFRVVRLILACICLFLACACAAKKPPAPAPARPQTEINDLIRFPQDAAAYFTPEEMDQPLLAPEKQAQYYSAFRKRHFAPWRWTEPRHERNDAMWGLGWMRSKTLYRENTLPVKKAFLDQLAALCDADAYPNVKLPAVVTANTSLRALPTDKPLFLDFKLAGEGFPFDYNQNSAVWAGTPVFLAHVSKDGAWYLAETRFAAGWVPATDVALVDLPAMQALEGEPMAAPVRDSVPLRDEEGIYRTQTRIGMLLPVTAQTDCGFEALLPVRDSRGWATVVRVRLDAADAVLAPLEPTPANFSRIADEMMGQPYGWGGLYGDRDCSSTLMDLFTPFGLFLPRNSSQQAQRGAFISFKDMSPAQKEALLRDQGKPFLTLVYKPGHIMLYIGQKNGRPLIYHTIWGLRTRNPSTGAEGRRVIGRTVITSLTPGEELPDLARPRGVLLETVTGMTVFSSP